MYVYVYVFDYHFNLVFEFMQLLDMLAIGYVLKFIQLWYGI